MWSTRRAEELQRKISGISALEKLRFTFAPSPENDFLGYFPADLTVDLERILGDDLEYLPPSKGLKSVDLVILTAHGSDVSPGIWSLRQRMPEETLFALWLWDNHLAHMPNLKCAIAADIVFPSHNYISGYLANPCSILGGHIPACSGQWTRDEAAAVFEGNVGKKRSDRLLVNYVDYTFSSRSTILRRLQRSVPEAEVLLMEPGDRSRYFGKTRSARLEEWLGHKATVILPVDSDLSTRVFDALLAGLVLLVPHHIADFDAVIPPVLQRELGIVRLPDLEMSTIRSGIGEAVRIFDEAGEAGARARHEFVLNNHMLAHRLKAIATYVKYGPGD